MSNEQLAAWELELLSMVPVPVGRLMTHPISKCKGKICCVHNPSDHLMKNWPQVYRADRKIMERTCPHGVGHPDPDDLRVRNNPAVEGVHGCDGCCQGKFPLKHPDQDQV